MQKIHSIQNIDKIANLIKNNKVAILPTDTVYGLCCLSNSYESIKRIQDIKNRSYNKPMQVLCKSVNEAINFASINKIETNMLEYGHTVILDLKKDNLFAENVFGKDKQHLSIGIRIPKNDFIIKLLSIIDCPLVATSVNFSGNNSAYKISDIDQKILNSVDLVVQYDDFCSGKQSSIADCRSGNLVFIR